MANNIIDKIKTHNFINIHSIVYFVEDNINLNCGDIDLLFIGDIRDSFNKRKNLIFHTPIWEDRNL